MTVDRYIAVFYPLRYPQIMKSNLVKITVTFIWCISFVTGCLPLIWNNETPHVKNLPKCNILSIVSNIYIWSFVIPPAILTNVTILYVYLRVLFLKHRQRRRVFAVQICGKTSQYSKHDTKTTAVIGIIIFSSVFVLTPFLVTVILVTSGVVIKNAKLMCSVTYELSFINPMFTPVLFAWRNESFKTVLKTVMQKKISQVTSRFKRKRSEASEIMEFGSTTITSA
ncbi:g_PROTEIN_RECEP_F1_2 domain-containing protein [Caerostris darwini]|uniref:G_PROTEIN_RECEP_F1_2 domain-containing protein n=1 Tax=Caerostris darwini TaxID=1538125 RepID=A0AAV4MXJ1_9ARAC|nr:g_PROTEIN_RECEP_F1_2 domain-containing protein [Caerostris darwini]